MAFQIQLDRVRKPADTYRFWAAANLIFAGSCTQDSFRYFVPWLMSLGRTTFERAIADPDSLADVPEVQRLAGGPRAWGEDDWPSWEELNYVARRYPFTGWSPDFFARSKAIVSIDSGRST